MATPAASALDFFAALRNVLRGPPVLAPANPHARPQGYGSLDAARAAEPKDRYAGALLLAYAQRLREATDRLAEDASRGSLHAFAVHMRAAQPWDDFVANLEGALHTYELDWGKSPLFLLETPSFRNAPHIVPWSLVHAEAQKIGLPGRPDMPELAHLTRDAAEIVHDYGVFQLHERQAAEVAAELQAQRPITSWPEALVLAAASSHVTDADEGLQVLMPQLGAADADADNTAIAKNFLAAARDLRAKLETSPVNAEDVAQARQEYESIRTVLEKLLQAS